MRLILVLLVLLYVCFVNAEEKTSGSIKNEYYLKSIGCETSSCKGLDYFAGSDSFGVGSTITICNVNNEFLKEKPFGKKHSSITNEVIQAVSNSVQSAMNGVTSSLGSIGSSGDTGDSGGGDDDDDDDDDSGNAKGNSRSYKGGNGRAVSEKSLKLLGKHSSITNDIIQAVSNSVQSAMNGVTSTMVSLSTSADAGGGEDDDDSGYFIGDKRFYKGGNGKAASDLLNLIRPKNHYGKCIKVLAVDLGDNKEETIDRPIISGSKKVCIDLFNNQSCKLEDEKIVSVVQSTKNDGFPNEGQFNVSEDEYNTIVKHGQILRKQCQLKGKCQFTRV
ncbi:hypothetical protein RB653_006517 [Dictyostelium firmibasis]|uniref:Uncharacterized protein n=1 Tax=Dictyostelium firmibasis TaxID=79012 RepID=A0AAN7YTS4_9MYCE